MSNTPAPNPATAVTHTDHLPPLTRTVWPCLNYRDAHAAIRFLSETFGFVPTLVVDGGYLIA